MTLKLMASKILLGLKSKLADVANEELNSRYKADDAMDCINWILIKLLISFVILPE